MEYGKFSSLEELLKGYDELEKSFTKKCQQLAELKNSIADGTNATASPSDARQTATAGADTVPQGGEDAVAASDGSARALQAASSCGQQCQQALRQDEVRPPSVMNGGGNVSMAMPSRPRTLKEASEMAKEFFK